MMPPWMALTFEIYPSVTGSNTKKSTGAHDSAPRGSSDFRAAILNGPESA